MKGYKKINTFSQAPSPAQIGSYLIFLMQVLIFYIIIQARLAAPPTRIVMLVLYSCSVACQVAVTLLVSLSDPSDSFMVRYRNNRNEVKNTEVSDMLYCDICRSYVLVNSRHCKKCGRCVENFDHHCIWVNNCVGSKNYCLFLAMIALTFLSMLMFLISAGLLWGQQGFAAFISEMGVVWASSVIVLVFAVLILNLILLHVYLGYLGITTYQFIMANKNKKPVGKPNDPNQQEMTQEAALQANKKSEDNLNASTQQAAKEKVDGLATIEVEAYNEAHSEIEKYAANRVKNESKPSKIYPSGLSNNVFHEDSDHLSNRSSISDKESIKITQFFTRNKSLKILVSHDAVVPHAPRSQLYSKTCSNSRDVAKISNLKK